MLSLKESIRPSSEIRNHYSEISRRCREEGEVVINTVNGKGDTVTLNYEEYKRQKARVELLEILAESEEDVRNGRVESIENTFENIRKLLKERG